MPIWPKRRPGARPPKGAAGFGGPLPRLERTLADRERVLGGDHRDTLAARNNLARAYLDAGRPAEAVPLLERTVVDSERVLGGDHPGTLTVRENLASAYLQAGRLAEAVPLFERTVADRERLLGSDHPQTMTARNNLAEAYLDGGRLAEAVPLLERTLADSERVLGGSHPSTLVSRSNLAGAYLREGRLAEAVPLFEGTLADSERVLGSGHPHTLIVRYNLTGAYGRAGRPSSRKGNPRGEVTQPASTGRLGENQVPARLRVVAVTELGVPVQGEAALVSGLLLGPFPVSLVQFTVYAPSATWPSPGTELTAVADLANPLNLTINWAEATDHRQPEPALQPQGGPTGWDQGPGGEHSKAVAEWLAAAGFATADFGGMLDPGLTGLLDAACARYASVIDDQAALELMRSGQPADGEVLAARKLDMPPELLPSPQTCVAWLTLAVTPQGGARYQVTMRFGFRSPERFTALATVGTKLPLRVDPADPRTVTIDLPALGITPG